MHSAFFDGWAPIVRTVCVGVPAYGFLIVLLRISGKRTLSKMNAFDLVVTVALGSTLSSILITRDVGLPQGVTALPTLVVLQFFISWIGVRIQWVHEVVTGEPSLLLRRGEMLRDALTRQRVSPEEVEAAARAAGLKSAAEADSIILETDGSFSVAPSR